MRLTTSRTGEIILLVFLAFSILWRGGKSIDATWILVGVVAALVFLAWKSSTREQLPVANGKLPNAVWLAGFAFVLWTFLSFLHSSTQNYGLDEVLRDSALFLLFCHVARTPADQRATRWRQFLMIVTVSAAVAALIGIAVYALQPVDRFVGTFFDARFHTDYWPNAWAEFLLLAWPAAVAQLMEARGWKRGILLIVLGLLVGSLLLSYSRGAWMVFGVQVALLVAVLIRKRRLSPKGTVSAVAVVGAIALALFFGANQLRSRHFPVQSVAEKVTFTATEGASSISERMQFWRQALILAKQRPFFGWGPYSFRFVQTPLMQGVLQTSDHPHNVLLKLSMERGTPGALLYAVFLISIVIVILRRRYPLPSNPLPSGGEVLFGLVGVLGVFLHTFVDYNLQFVGIAAPLSVMLGFLVAESVYNPPSLLKGGGVGEGFPWLERILAGTLLAIALIEGIFLGMSSLGRHAEARGDTAAALAWYQRSRSEIFSRDMGLSRANLLINENDFPKGSIAIDEYFSQNEHDVRALKMSGILQHAEGLLSQAVTSYEKAYASGKWTDIGILFSLLNLQRSTSGALDEAKYREYESLVLAYGRAIEQNIHFIALSPNVEAFMVVAKLLPALCPLQQDACERSRAQLELLSASADRNAKKERAEYRVRPGGYLW